MPSIYTQNILSGSPIGLFSKRTDVDKELEKLYIEKFMSIGIDQKGISEAMRKCKQDAIREETDNLPKNFGDYLISKANDGFEKSVKLINKSKSCGANEDDIRHWWNLHDIERRMLKWEDDIFRISTFESLKQDGLSDEEAIEKMRKTFPLYGNPTDESNTKGEDRPLPDELHDRVNRLTAELTTIYIQKYLQNYSSMNAFLRYELKQ